jgi:hypothetical protein
MKLRIVCVLLYFIGSDVMTLVVYGRVRYVSSGLECRPKYWVVVGYFLSTLHVGMVAHDEWFGFASQTLRKAVPSHHRSAWARCKVFAWSLCLNALDVRFSKQVDWQLSLRVRLCNGPSISLWSNSHTQLMGTRTFREIWLRTKSFVFSWWLHVSVGLCSRFGKGKWRTKYIKT